MEETYFLLRDKIKEIQNKFLLQNGWQKIYERCPSTEDNSGLIYCCLVANTHIDKYNKDYHWPVLLGQEGKPAVYGGGLYKTYRDEGVEPFLFWKSFSLSDNSISYIDVAEEFILYYNLLEKGNEKQNRTFYYVDDYGELDEVLVVEPNLVKIKTKYLKEYITIRDMHFVICYDYMRLVDGLPQSWDFKFKDELIEGKDIIYSHLIRNDFGKTQSWIMGKVILKPNEIKRTHFDMDNYKYEEFIVGYSQEGELSYENCGNSDENPFTITYFKKEVLDKYYNEPNKYQVDGFSVKSSFFILKIDNNVDSYVPVFLRDLRILSHKEQLHWKQYNIPPTDGMSFSRTYYTTMIEGKWVEKPETVDLFFKYRYNDFNKKWENKFGWNLYKPLSDKDNYLFVSLHQITSNNIKSFCEQTLTIVKLTIDRLNEKEITKGLNLDPKIKGIGKFEKFLEAKGILTLSDMFVFLRNLQNLRSGLIAHSFSESNKDCKKAIDFFKIKDDNLESILEDIFVKSIQTFNSLEKCFEL